MKKLLKCASSLALAVLLVFSLGTMAFAATPSITFRGFTQGFEFQPGSEFTQTDLFDGFKGVMPGEVRTQEITFSNAATDCDFVHLYMRAEPHSETNALSENVAKKENLDTMAAFLAQLSMKVWNGTQLIYESTPDQPAQLLKNTFLGTFRSGDTATLKVELSIPIELSNDYANRVGEVDWIFHVEAYNESQLSVRKVWSDGNENHKEDSITVNLLKDGKVETSAELNAENGWAYTFDQLVEGYTWTVEEAEVPEGYAVDYETVGTTVTITNTKNTPEEKPGEPLDITVKKVWSGDTAKERPASVTVTLYNGKNAYETVVLNKANNWSHHWKDLSVLGSWQVTETNIPSGYTPTYKVTDKVVTITNTRKLIQTGQLNMPVWILSGVGIALVALGGAMVLTRKKREDV